MFDRGSRYETVPDAVFTDADGKQIPYKRLRLLPAGGPSVQVHQVVLGDRLDRLSAQYLQDPEQFWRLADANRVLRPEDLTAVVGRRLIVPFRVGP
jgi:hypothetical protein